MRIGGKFLNLIAFSALMTMAAGSFAQDSVGMVVAARGDVSVTSDGGSRPIGQGDFIHEHDQINAGNRSFTVLQLVDGAKLTLRPDSELIIEEYDFTGGEGNAVTLSLVSGGLRVIAGAIAASGDGNFRIRTPSSLLAVTESDSSLSLCKDKICDQKGLVELPEQTQ